MKTFNEWKDSYLKENPKDLSLDHSVLMKRFNDYIKENLVTNKEDKMKEYKVSYENTKETKKIQADKAKDAYLKFLDDAEPKNKAVHVLYASVLDGKETKQTFRDHLSDSAKAEAVSSDNFQPILYKLDEIHSTMKAIRWTIAGGFLFIILVITGIIKPGIFG